MGSQQNGLFLKGSFIIFLFYAYGYLSASTFVYHRDAVPVKVRKGHQTPGSWSYRWLCAAQGGFWDQNLVRLQEQPVL